MKLFGKDFSLEKLSGLVRFSSTRGSRKLWRRLWKNQFHGLEFVKNKMIGTTAVNFYCNSAKLGIRIAVWGNIETGMNKKVIKDNTVFIVTEEFVYRKTDEFMGVLEDWLKTVHLKSNT